MKTSFKKIMVASSMLLIGACSEIDTSRGYTEEPAGIADAKIKGLCEKGPLKEGSKVYLYELDSETSEKTGKNFETNVVSDKGDFLFKEVSLKNPVALFEGNGYYTDDITGKKSEQKATLYALADLSKNDFVNMNLLTTFEYKRILYLMNEKSMGFEKAQTKASEEVLAAFKTVGDFDNMENSSIFGNSDESAYLFAISVLLETVVGNDNINDFIEEICNDLEKDGALDEVDLFGSFRKNLDSLNLKEIRKNLERLDMGKVPEFEKFVCFFAGKDSSKVEGCAVSYTVGGSASEIAADSSSSAEDDSSDDSEVIEKCITKPMQDTTKDGLIRKGQLVVCGDSVSLTWEPLPVCGDKEYNVESSFCVEDSLYAFCEGKAYDPNEQFCVNDVLYDYCGKTLSEGACAYDPKVVSCNKDGLLKGKMTDPRDNHEYEIVQIGCQVWMAENMDLYVPVDSNGEGSWLYRENAGEVNYYGDPLPKAELDVIEKKFGRLYSFTVADTVCPAGWHMPDTLEWDAVYQYLGGGQAALEAMASTDLPGSEKWPNAGVKRLKEDWNFTPTNASGLNIVAGGERMYGAFQYLEVLGKYFAANQRGVFFFRYKDRMDYIKLGDTYSARCVMD